MKSAFVKSAALAALVAGAMGAGLSATDAQAGSKSFMRADTNGDGFVTREELRINGIRRSSLFNRADIENDGRLTPTEFRRMEVFQMLARGRDND